MSSTNAESWGSAITLEIGRQIRRFRGKRSAQWVSDRTAEIGMRINRATISEIETGRRKMVTVAELLIFAAALDTSPAMLLYGHRLADGHIPALPSTTTRASDALMWFSGLKAITPDGSEEYTATNEPVSLVHARDSIEASLRFVRSDPQMIQFTARQFADVQERMRLEGMIVEEDAGGNDREL